MWHPAKAVFCGDVTSYPIGAGPLGDAKFSSCEKISLGLSRSLPYFAINIR